MVAWATTNWSSCLVARCNEGLTPVSALIHAATMVTAGVFLLIVMSPLLQAPRANFILIVGSITCIFASSVAVFQNDIKNNCYQLVTIGRMFMAIGSSAYTLHTFIYYHMLFYGAFIFRFSYSFYVDEQDIKKWGFTIKYPLTITKFIDLYH